MFGFLENWLHDGVRINCNHRGSFGILHVDLVHEAGVSDGVAFFVPCATMIVGIAGVLLCAHGVSQEGDKCCPDGTCVVFSIGLLMVGEIYKKGFL